MYPTFEYLLYFIGSAFTMMVLFLLGSLFLRSKIKKESIYSMIREEE